MNERRYYRFAAPGGVLTISIFGLANTLNVNQHAHPPEAMPALIQPSQFGGGTASVALDVQQTPSYRYFGGSISF